MVTPIEKRYIDNNPKSSELYSTSRDIFPNGVTHEARNQRPFPHFVTHAFGPHKWDIDGHRLIDYRTGHGSLILGHSHPEIIASVNEQIAKGTHYSASTILEIEWAQWVQKLIPSAQKVRFQNSGTEATMMAFRMARAYTGKSKIVKFEHHFHGWNDYALAGGIGLGGVPDETLSTMIVLPPNDISVVEKTLEREDIAAVILEPTGAHMGEEPIKPEFLTELRAATEQRGVVLIMDEVVTGFRVSKGGAQEHYGVDPDLTTLAKILGGGLPGGAVAGKAEILNLLELRDDDPEYNQKTRISHPGTFNGNPLSAAAGTKALELLYTTPINEKTNSAGRKLKRGLNDLLSRMEIPGCASGLDSVVFLRLGVDHDCDREICDLPPDQLSKTRNSYRNRQLNLALLNHGIDSSTRFLMGSTFSEEDIYETVEGVGRALVDIREQGLI